MRVGVCKLTLYISDARSLKDKRRVVRSLVDKLRGTFRVAVAEVAHMDLHTQAALGVACVANEQRHVEQVLQSVMRYVDSRTDVLLTDTEIDYY